MPPLSDVNIVLDNGNLGQLPANDDGVCALIASGVAVGGQFALGDVLGPYRSIVDAEDNGITEAYDVTNTCLVWHHINDFFQQRGNGEELFVMVVAKTVTMTQMCDKANQHVRKLIESDVTGGRIHLVGVTRVPDGAYTPSYSAQLDTDIRAAAIKAQELIMHTTDGQFMLHRPFRVLLEGRDWQGNASSTLDLTDGVAGPNTNTVGIVLVQNTAMAAAHAEADKHAAVGLVLGMASSIQVHQDLGRVRNGALYIDEVGLSNGAALSTFTTVNLNTLNDAGYIFARTFVGKAGKFLNGDSMACPITDDYCFLNRGRVIDKAARIVYLTYLDFLRDDVEINEDTGRLAVATCKNLQGVVEQALETQMAGEITRASAFVNDAQNIIATGTLAIQVNVVPMGTARQINVTLQFENPFNA